MGVWTHTYIHILHKHKHANLHATLHNTVLQQVLCSTADLAAFQ